jgi:protein-disulfide isomerase
MKRLPSTLVLCAAALAACKTATTEKPAAPAQGSTAARPGATVIDPSTQVATVDGQPVTYGDVEKEQKDLARNIKAKETQLQSEVYELRKDALDNLISKRLLEAEAKKAGKPLDQWMKEDFDKTVAKPTDAEMKTVYEGAKERLPEGSNFETFKGQISEFLMRQKRQEALQKKIEELKTQHKVTVALAAPEVQRVEVAATGPAKGPQNAKITIVEFSDFQCPFCSREVAVVDRVLKEYDGKVRLVFRHFPLDFHQQAGKAAEASLCAADQGKFWELHDKMFENQKELEVPKLKEYAKAVGVDAGKFDKCLDSGEKKGHVEADTKAGSEAGVSGTPAFFVNGVLVSGAQPFEKFKDVIDRELQR